MSIKIYNVVGLGFVLGEKISQDENNIYLKYPAVLVLQAQTQQGPRDMLIEPVPHIFAGRDGILTRFPLKKDLIVYGGKPEINVIELYNQYAAQMQTRLTGIQVVGAGAMPPTPPKNEPINNKPRLV